MRRQEAVTRICFLVSIAMSCLIFSARDAAAIPATSFKVVDTTTFAPPNDSSWFLRADSSNDLPFKGMTGFGVSAGTMGEYMFLDLSFMYYIARYGAVRAYQPGIVLPESRLDPNNEIGRPRSDSNTGSMISAGPGIGFMFKFLGSDKWVEIGRFGLNYAQYSDQTNGISFRGALATFHGELAYRLTEAVMLAPGMTYNIGFVDRTDGGLANDTPHTAFLPLQWWSWQLGLYLWL
ncbi:MAG: hypothetical protein HY074_08620 [Deltaproteobacteria bacterium]|nr:hypothetical protein [Deltaproteobacteria bacterium]